MEHPWKPVTFSVAKRAWADINSTCTVAVPRDVLLHAFLWVECFSTPSPDGTGMIRRNLAEMNFQFEEFLVPTKNKLVWALEPIPAKKALLIPPPPTEDTRDLLYVFMGCNFPFLPLSLSAQYQSLKKYSGQEIYSFFHRLACAAAHCTLPQQPFFVNEQKISPPF